MANSSSASSDLLGIGCLVALGLMGFGAYFGIKGVLAEFSGTDGPAYVTCRVGAVVVYEGMTKHGAQRGWGKYTVVDMDGTETSFDDSANCVTQVFKKKP